MNSLFDTKLKIETYFNTTDGKLKESRFPSLVKYYLDKRYNSI